MTDCNRGLRVQEFITAFHRESAVMSDSLGLDLTPSELRFIKQQLIYLWLYEQFIYPGGELFQNKAGGGPSEVTEEQRNDHGHLEAE